MKFAEHVARITDVNNPHNILFNTLESKREVGKRRWQGKIILRGIIKMIRMVELSCCTFTFVYENRTKDCRQWRNLV